MRITGWWSGDITNDDEYGAAYLEQAYKIKKNGKLIPCTQAETVTTL